MHANFPIVLYHQGTAPDRHLEVSPSTYILLPPSLLDHSTLLYPPTSPAKPQAERGTQLESILANCCDRKNFSKEYLLARSAHANITVISHVHKVHYCVLIAFLALENIEKYIVYRIRNVC